MMNKLADAQYDFMKNNFAPCYLSSDDLATRIIAKKIVF